MPLVSHSRLRTLRRAALRLAIAAIVVVVGRLLFLQGWIGAVRIVGGSMAETLLGEHYRLTCADCRRSLRFDRDGTSLDEPIACWNCGYPRLLARPADLAPGQRVLVDRWPALVSSAALARGELVALRMPGEPGQLAVKRIVGLPGERIAIRRGELFVDDRLLRKDWPQIRELAVPVHDDRHRPSRTENLPPRWAPDASASDTSTGWRRLPDGYEYLPRPSAAGGTPADDRSPGDRLSYRHWRGTISPLPRTEEAAILDNDAYNPRASRALHEATDLMLAATARWAPATQFSVSIDDGRLVWEASFDPGAGRFQLFRDGRPTDAWSERPLASDRPTRIEFAVVDRQVLLAIDGRAIGRHAFDGTADGTADDGASTPRRVLRPAAITAGGGRLRVTELQLFRDVYWLPVVGLGAAEQEKSGEAPNGYFLLGDNPAISHDSRFRSFGRPARDAIVGRVLARRTFAGSDSPDSIFPRSLAWP